MDFTQFKAPDLNARKGRKIAWPRKVYIVSAGRTAIGKLMGGLGQEPAVKLGSHVLKHLAEQLPTEAQSEIGEVILGQVLPAGCGQNPARQAAIGAGLSDKIPCLTINKVCGSGLKSVMLGAQSISLGDHEAVLAGGMESMSLSPYLLPKARAGYRLGHGTLIDSMVQDGLWDAYNDMHMGLTGELVAHRYGLTREAQDRYALESHQKAAKAIESGLYQAEIIPYEVVSRKGTTTFATDESVRLDSSLESLSRLRPAFLKEGTVTAGNAPGVNDGAAAVLLASEEFCEKYNLKPLAVIYDQVAVGLSPEWVMLSPVVAIRTLLERNPEIPQSAIDAFEVNEAFSAQALAVIEECQLDTAKVNSWGGSVAMGHPIGASGTRVLTTLLSRLSHSQGTTGLVTLCLGGGNGVGMLLQRV